MRRKLMFGIMALATIASVSVGFSGSQARDKAGSSSSLGYVTNDGIVLKFTGGFDAVIQKVIRQANSERQQWQFCTNPPRGPFVLPRFPGQQQSCGPEPRPFNPDSAGTFSLYELVWSPTGTKVGERLSTFTFSNPGDNAIPLSKPITGKCVVIADARGNFVPIRSGSGERFAFSNPFSPLNGEVEQAQAEVDRLNREIASVEARTSSGSSNLSARMADFSRAGGRTGNEGMYCPTVAQRSLPPRPTNAMSSAEIELQANGSCVDVMLRRHDRNKVINALAAVDRTDTAISNYRTWQGRKAQCSLVNPHNEDVDFGVRFNCGGISDIICYQEIRRVFNQCKAVVRNSCGGSISAYNAEVERIRREPQEQMNRCANAMAAVQDARASLNDNDYGLQGLRNDLAGAQQRLAAAQARPRAQGQSLSLSDARCGG